MKDLFHHSTSSASRCYNHIQPWLLLCNAEKWAASIMCWQPHLVARKGTAACPVWGETCRTRLLSAASLCLSCAEDSVFVSEEMFSCSASTDGPSVPLWTGSDAGDDSLPGDLPDRPGDDGHCYEGLHWGPTLHMFSYCHKFFGFFSPSLAGFYLCYLMFLISFLRVVWSTLRREERWIKFYCLFDWF